MPATAGRVRMPHNNRVTTSSTLNTTSVWKNVIGYDPHANPGSGQLPVASGETEHAKQLMDLAKIRKQREEGVTAAANSAFGTNERAFHVAKLTKRRNRLTLEAAATLGWEPDHSLPHAAAAGSGSQAESGGARRRSSHESKLSGDRDRSSRRYSSRDDDRDRSSRRYSSRDDDRDRSSRRYSSRDDDRDRSSRR